MSDQMRIDFITLLAIDDASRAEGDYAQLAAKWAKNAKSYRDCGRKYAEAVAVRCDEIAQWFAMAEALKYNLKFHPQPDPNASPTSFEDWRKIPETRSAYWIQFMIGLN